ncbi:MAG: pyridoxamine 5'-phosphate oxidase family protein [Blastocatellales bacterium]
MNWGQFSDAAPELAAKGATLFEGPGVVLIGTVRKDGSPRISPVEAMIHDGRLYLGMMWQSLKALDLMRDPRCTVHNLIADRMAADGEFKLHGRAGEVRDDVERKGYCQAVFKKMGWSPEGMKFHLFSIDIESAGLFTQDGDKRLITLFRPAEGISRFHHFIDGRKVRVP